MEMRHQIVQFRLADIYFPELAKVAVWLCEGGMLQGEVVDLSDRGRDQEAFAVVKVAQFDQPVLVPVARLEICSQSSVSNPANPIP